MTIFPYDRDTEIKVVMIQIENKKHEETLYMGIVLNCCLFIY